MTLGTLFWVSGGCVSARKLDTRVDDAFGRGDYAAATQYLEDGVKRQGEEGKDALLYLMDLGLTQHTRGDYGSSTRTLLKADQMAEIKDYTSLSREASTLLVSDTTKPYKGEDFEKVLINSYLALNFALQEDYESALVEARKVNRKLYLMVNEGKRNYQQSAFARYLSALLFESSGQFNDAYVDYKLTRELMPGWKRLGEDLYRMAYLLRMPDEMERWQKEYQLAEEDRQQALELTRGKPRPGELIVIFQNGISPVKVPNPDFHSVPMFRARRNPVRAAEVRVDGRYLGATEVLHDIESTAIQNLRDNTAGIIAKKIGGAFAKGMVGAGVARATKNEGLGELVNLVLYVADQADTRSWALLPRDLQILRAPLAEGDYDVEVHPVRSGRKPFRQRVKVTSGKRTWVNIRYVP